jgi:hypothetical protein
VAEWFFHDDARPLAVFFFGEANFAELLNDEREKFKGDGEVVEKIALCAMVFIGFGDLAFEALVRLGIFKIALNVVNAFQKPLPQLWIDGVIFEFVDFFVEKRPERIGVHLVEGESDNGELLRKKTFLLQVDERGDELALGQVAARPENHHYAGRANRSGVGLRSIHLVDPVSTGQIAGEKRNCLVSGFFLDVAAELKPHGGENLGGEITFAARSEALKERRREDGRRSSGFDRCENGPAAFARIRDAA